MSINVRAKDFGMKDTDDYLVGMKNKDKYIAYCNEYRTVHGVFPELDKINKPFSAKWIDAYEMGCILMKRGFVGALYYHDLHGHFNKRAKRIFEKYISQWSFRVSLDSYGNIWDGKAVEDHIENGLGTVLNNDGFYYEGTWENGNLVYGLVAGENTNFVGRIEYNSTVTYHGVVGEVIDQGKKSKYKHSYYYNVRCGTFIKENNAWVPYDSEIAAATATVIPTMGLLPAPMRPIISVR